MTQWGLMAFLPLESCTHLYSFVSLCVGVCMSERSLHIVIQETHMIACDWGCEAQQTGRLPAQTVQWAGAVKPCGCKRPSARSQRRQVGLKASGRWCVVSNLESRRALLKLPCGCSASFSAACTITSARKEMESEKDLSSGCCNSGYTGTGTYWMWDVGLFLWLDEEHLSSVCVCVCARAAENPLFPSHM